MPDHTYATRVLLRAIQGLRTGHPVTVDLIRDELDTAQCTPAEKSGAFRTAITDGYLTGVFLSAPGFDITYPIHGCTPSTHPAGKGRPVQVYRRTSKPIPEHVCAVS